MPIKGYKRKESLPQASFLADALKGIDRLKADLEKKFSQRIEEAVAEIQNRSDEIIDSVKNMEFIKGDPGKDADENALERRLSAKIPNPADIERAILSKVPRVDEEKLTRRLLAKVPKRDVKIIENKVEVDPMAIIDQIMDLPEEKRKKLRVKSENVDGLQQTISAMHTQLGRGYLHGGGLSSVSHDSSLTGQGTPTSPLSVTGSSQPFFLAQTPQGNSRALLEGDVDGSNTTFQVPEGVYSPGSLSVSLNGQGMTEGNLYDFVETDPGTGVFDFITPPQIGDRITVSYA